MNEAWTTSEFSLPEWPVKQILKLTTLSDTFLVGGTVRDLILKRPLHDWDFVTHTNGIILAKKAANSLNGAFYALDKNRGTGRAVVHPPNSQLPITLDFASIRGDDLTSDLKSRDFTINSMAMSLNGRLIDPLKCAGDLSCKIIRITTSSSFINDPIRLMRAIRQSHVLNYKIEDATYDALLKHTRRITEVSPERVLSELCAMLSYPTTAPQIASLKATGLLQHILPELHHVSGFDGKSTKTHMDDWQVTIQTLKRADLILARIEDHLQDVGLPAYFEPFIGWRDIIDVLRPQFRALRIYFNEMVNSGFTHGTILRWASLLQFIPVEAIQNRLTVLRTPKRTINSISKVLQTTSALSQLSTGINRKHIYRFYKQADRALPCAVIYTLAVLTATAVEETNDNILERFSHNAGILLNTYFEDIESLSPEPFLRGNALIQLGITPGPDVGLVLDRLIEAQISGEVTSQSSAVDFVNRIISRDR